MFWTLLFLHFYVSCVAERYKRCYYFLGVHKATKFKQIFILLPFSKYPSKVVRNVGSRATARRRTSSRSPSSTTPAWHRWYVSIFCLRIYCASAFFWRIRCASVECRFFAGWSSHLFVSSPPPSKVAVLLVIVTISARPHASVRRGARQF